MPLGPRSVGPQRPATLFLAIAAMSLFAGALAPAAQPDAWGSVSTVVRGTGSGGDLSHVDYASDGAVQRTFDWRHGGHQWHLNVSVDRALLDAYAARDRLPYSHDYAAYVFDTRDDPWVLALAQELDRMFTSVGLSGRDKLDAHLAFAQHFPYALDKETTPYSEWPRYPAETLMAEASDCEDTTILFVSILRALGHDAVLLNPPRHLAAGVALDPSEEGFSVAHEGRHYYYAETTGENWAIGKLPKRFHGEEIRVLTLGPQPILSRPTWEVERMDGTLLVTLTAHNVGNLPAHEVSLGTTLRSSAGKGWQRASCDPTSVDGATTVTCTVVLTAPPAGEEVRLRAWVKAADAKDRSDSGTFVIP